MATELIRSPPPHRLAEGSYGGMYLYCKLIDAWLSASLLNGENLPLFPLSKHLEPRKQEGLL